MTTLNADIICEIARHLGIDDLLSLAHTCSNAFQASNLYALWKPHEFDPSNGLSAFLPSDRIGPWRSYSGNDIRLAARKMLRFKVNWLSENPRSQYRVHIGEYPRSLIGIPGTRWLYYYNSREDLPSMVVGFVDGRTGISTNVDIAISSDGTDYSGHIPSIYSLEPSETFLGISGNDSFNTTHIALFRMHLSVCKDTKGHFIGVEKTQVRLWKEVASEPMITLNSEFLVTMGHGPLLNSELNIFHIQSGRRWKWLFPQIPPCPEQRLVDDWCFLILRSPEVFRIIAIHLPSLLLLPESAGMALVASEGHFVPASTFLGDSTTEYMTIHIYEKARGYRVLYSTHDHRVAFDIQVEPTQGSIYGNITLHCTTQIQRIERVLVEEVEAHHTRSVGHIPREFQSPLGFANRISGFNLVASGYNQSHLEVLCWADTREDRPGRSLSWKGPMKHHPSVLIKEEDHPESYDLIEQVDYCDATIGVFILRQARGRGLPPIYQTCWF